MAEANSRQLRIDNVRFNFTNTLFDPKGTQDNPDAKKFSVVAIIARDHPQLPAIKAAMLAAAESKWPGKGADMLKQLQAADRLCLHDGDAKADFPGYKGNFYINASNALRPLVVGPDRQPLVAADGKPFSGSYGNVMIEFWAQDNKFGKRVNASLLGAQHIKDGERLSGGGVASADDFDAIPQAAAEAAATTGQGAASLF